MKKTRFLVLALVVAVMLMGAGYAWWNDTITVQSTVTTGTLNVDIVDQAVTPDAYVNMQVIPDFDRDSEDGDAALIKFINVYPGAGGKATLIFKNKSTMAVKLDKAISFTLDNVDENFETWFGYPWDNQYVGITYTSGLQNVPFYVSGGNYTYDGDPITIEPDATATFVLTAKLPEAAGNNTMNCDQLGFTINPNFIQFNQP